jgi:hypothetical protein
MHKQEHLGSITYGLYLFYFFQGIIISPDMVKKLGRNLKDSRR